MTDSKFLGLVPPSLPSQLRLILDNEAGMRAPPIMMPPGPAVVETGEDAAAVPPATAVAAAAATTSSRWAVVEAMQGGLRAVAADQDRIILDVCNANAPDICSCVSELGGMQAAAADLRTMLAKGNSALQARWERGGLST